MKRLMIESWNDTLRVSGNGTFDSRGTLKALGFKWNAKGKYWAKALPLFSPEAMEVKEEAEKVAKVLAGQVEVSYAPPGYGGFLKTKTWQDGQWVNAVQFMTVGQYMSEQGITAEQVAGN